jgi:outer membrane protein OmpA-like peptidoglycan-associated protein
MKTRTFFISIACVVCVSLIAGTGCATKKYVQGELVTIDQKVEGVEMGVEENQKRLREHDEQLDTIGAIIKQHESQIDEVDGKIDSKIAEVRKIARGNLIFTETLRNNEATFKFDSYELTEEAKSVLDAFVQKLIAEDKGRYLEIQGHTDSTGTEEWNVLLGKKRAEAVMEYLYKQHRIPLHRMEAISFGSSTPLAENSTRDGRAKNRRVEILVFE